MPDLNAKISGLTIDGARAAAFARLAATIVAADDGGRDDDDDGRDGQTAIITKAKPKTQRPSLYKVLLLNDDYTPMEFVVHVLERIFGMTNAQALELMLRWALRASLQATGMAVPAQFMRKIRRCGGLQTLPIGRATQAAYLWPAARLAT